ncbi:cation:proton antiporter, partial [Streptomyces sp. SID8455]|nr:cation:proton antiporter [Streptomyces sp. SID8455]
RDLTGRAPRSALALFASTCLPLVVAITAIGLDEKVIGAGEAAALVAAAMVSVLTFPLLAFRLLGRGEGDAGPGAPSR